MVYEIKFLGILLVKFNKIFMNDLHELIVITYKVSLTLWIWALVINLTLPKKFKWYDFFNKVLKKSLIVFIITQIYLIVIQL